ncbi:hypothetical protein [Clostridium sp.]|uniref:hypothetical protein n=1 Tax=Clostridium sp. TaxID=1506 RepID=UPI00260FD4AF|nr:hypothetical protein [Clostridium sp.]
MNKVSAITKSQATYKFNQRRQQIIENTLNKNKNTYGNENFQDILNMFLKNN